MKNVLENNEKLAFYVGAVVMGEYKGANGGYSDSKLLDFGTEEVKTNVKNFKTKYSGYPENSRYWSHTQLKYHESWDWLLPVLQKMTNQYNSQKSIKCELTTLFKFTSLEDAYNEALYFLNNLN